MTSSQYVDQTDVEEIYDAYSHHPSIDIVDDSPTEKGHPLVRTQSQRIKRHFKTRWKLYVIEAIILLAICLTLFFLVIIPRVVQDMVNAASFPLSSADVSKPSADGFTMSMEASLMLPGSFSVVVDPLNLTLSEASNSGEDSPFAWVVVPQATLQGNSTLSISQAQVPIINSTAFDSFIQSATYSESFELRAQGSTTVHVGGLHAGVQIDKTIPQKGFDNFKGFSVPEVALLITPEDDGTNVIGNTTIPNPTLFSLELGNFTINVMCAGINLGQATVTDLTLHPGNNTVPIRGQVDIGAIFNNIEEILSAQADALQHGNVEFNATLNSTSYNGVQLVDFETALKDMELTAQIPIFEVLNDTFTSFFSGISSTDNLTQDILNLLDSPDISSLFPPEDFKHNRKSE